MNFRLNIHEYKFQLELSEVTVCSECASFLADINAFKFRTIAMQEMFDKLERNPTKSDLTEVENINLIRIHFGLMEGASEVLLDPSDEIEEDSKEADIKDDKPDFFMDCYEQEAEYIDGSDTIAYEETPSPSQDNRRKSYRRKNLEKTENEKLYEFKCHICDLEFSKMQLLSAHCRSSHQTNPQVLCWCGVVLSTWKRLMAHKSKHIKEDDEFNCSKCNISYKTKSAFEKHNLTKHGPDAVRFMCAICGKEFKERQVLKNHEKIHLPDELKLKHPCTYCAKKFVNSHCLKIHIARVHEKVALHTCELCGKGCITKSDLKWHMDKHVEERNFECEICHLKFKSTNSLRIHKRRHFNQDKVIVCPICGKEFFTSAALSNHKVKFVNPSNVTF